MRRIAAWSHDHRRLVLASWLGAIVLFAAIAAGAGGGFVNNFSLKGSESQRALDLLKERFPQQSGDVDQIVFRARSGHITDASGQKVIAQAVADVRRLPSVTSVAPPATKNGQVSRDGTIAFATVLFDQQAIDLDVDDVQRVIDHAKSHATSGVQVELGGRAIQQAEKPETGAGELIGVASAIVVLMVVLGSAAAMTIPLLVAFVALGVAMTAVLAASAVVDIADFGPTLAVMIGLGVGIDYALLIVNRFRTERAQGRDVRDAIIVAVDTGGRAVLFAGITVVIALLGMLTLGIGILNGPSVAAALTVALTITSALTLLPALVGFYGHRIKVPDNLDPDAETGFWSRFSAFVMRRRALLAPAAVVLLIVLALPATNMKLGLSDAGNLPSKDTARKAYDLLSKGFGPGFNGPLLVSATTKDGTGISELRAALQRDGDVAAVGAPTDNAARDTAVLQVIPKSKPQDEATKDLTHRVRDDVVPPIERAYGLQAYVGGSTATGIDVSQAMADKLPLFIAVVVGLSLVLLLVVFRSVLIPLKAGLMNLLSIGATLGVITFVFQEGHLASLIGVETTAPIESFLPMFLFAVIFGLSMDYEVFLVSRMHEVWGHRKDNSHAVRHGLALTGRIVLAAAIIMISVFGSFVLAEDRIIKLFGLGLASAIVFDAFVVRLVLVPALMHLLGRRNWWLPSGLADRLPRLSVEGPSPVTESE
jgi:RND superfamily putative drug exporter